jgi:hypothetical protein
MHARSYAVYKNTSISKIVVDLPGPTCVMPSYPPRPLPTHTTNPETSWHTQAGVIPSFYISSQQPQLYIHSYMFNIAFSIPTTSNNAPLHPFFLRPKGQNNQSRLQVRKKNTMANNDASQSVPAATSGSRSKLLSTNFKNFLSKPAVTHPQKALTVELHNADVKSNHKSEEVQSDTAGETRKSTDK